MARTLTGEIEIPHVVDRLSILDTEGNVREGADPGLPKGDLLALYRTMLLVREFDERMLRLQRQGRMGTFAPVKGQEAAQLGSIHALRKEDWFVPAFRETAAAVWRGAKLDDLLLYNGGYEEGVAIPDDAHDLPIAIPVGSQICHAAGIALAAKRRGLDEVAITYFGDGATSTGDFHAGLNFAGVYQAPVVFLCQNNHYAISIPREQQTRSRTLAQKAVAYGIPGIQVDGNDILAVYAATRDAVARARAGDGPTLIEAVTYRLEVHTTADDPKKYREDTEVEEWRKKDPLLRFRSYLEKQGHLGGRQHDEWVADAKEKVNAAVEKYERRRDELGDPMDMFRHNLSDEPPFLARQREEFEEFLDRAGLRESAAESHDEDVDESLRESLGGS